MPFMSSGVRMMKCGALLEPSQGAAFGGPRSRRSPVFVNDKKVVLRQCGPSRKPSWPWAGLGTVGEIGDAIDEQTEAP